MTPADSTPIPAFVNSHSGTAAASVAALRAAGPLFTVHEVEPQQLAAEIARAVAAGVKRLAIAGGDGSVETAAAVLAGSPVELAVIPGGTLNHFARDHGIPLKPSEAVEVAATGVPHAADVGVVNDQVFINTSCVGVYVVFVRVRNRLRPFIGYHLASVVAAFRILGRVRPLTVHLTVAGEDRVHRTPLLFVGVGERKMGPPEFGGRVPGGQRVLHVVVVGRGREARRWTRAYNRAQRAEGRVVREERSPLFDELLVDACRVELSHPRDNVGLDGEIRRMAAPLAYRLWRDALRVVGPRAKLEKGESGD